MIEMMTIPEILKELEPYTGRFPMKAMRAAIQQREAITPELMRVVQSVVGLRGRRPARAGIAGGGAAGVRRGFD